jgi:alkaline phosphatase D
VVVVTGDVHSSWAWEGPANDGGRPAMVELVTPSVSAEALAERLPLPAVAVEAVLRGADPDLAHVELSSHGYLLVDLDPERVQAEWWYVDPADAATHNLGAARRAPITVPMHLTEVDEALPDPVPPTAPPSTTTTTRAEPADPSSDGGGLPVVPVGVGATAAVAALGAAIAVRRRTR